MSAASSARDSKLSRMKKKLPPLIMHISRPPPPVEIDKNCPESTTRSEGRSQIQKCPRNLVLLRIWEHWLKIQNRLGNKRQRMEFIYNAGNPKNIRLTKEQKFELTFCVI